jgi:4-nitrophenyl phosphatase
MIMANLIPKAILLDMDGVLWRAYQPIIDLKDLFNRIEALGSRAYCISNNSTITVTSYQEKLSEMGVDLDLDQIVSAAVASADFLSRNIPENGSIFLIGEDGLRETLLDSGFRINEDDQSQVDAVVVGLDFKINYLKLTHAANLIRSGALFIGTNPDKTFPVPGGVYPGAGTIIKAVSTASGKEPIIMGKPEPFLYNLIMERARSKPNETLMVGDRLDTDILGAQQLGIQTALVLTGVTERDAAERWEPAPDLIAENVLGVIEAIS